MVRIHWLGSGVIKVTTWKFNEFQLTLVIPYELLAFLLFIYGNASSFYTR